MDVLEKRKRRPYRSSKSNPTRTHPFKPFSLFSLPVREYGNRGESFSHVTSLLFNNLMRYGLELHFSYYPIGDDFLAREENDDEIEFRN